MTAAIKNRYEEGKSFEKGSSLKNEENVKEIAKKEQGLYFLKNQECKIYKSFDRKYIFAKTMN